MDTAPLLFFQLIRCPFLTAFFGVFSFIGEGALLAVAIAAACFLLPEKSSRLLFAASVSLCVNCALKCAVARIRPYAAGTVSLEPIDTVFFSTVHLDDYTSFPSGHAQITATLFTVLYLLHPRTWSLSCAIFVPFFTALSRLYFGVHYPSDVIAGLLFGYAVGTIVCVTERNRTAASALAALSLFALFFLPSREYALSAGLLAGCAVFLPAPRRLPVFPVISPKPIPRLLSGTLLAAAIIFPAFTFSGNAFSLLCGFFLAGALTSGAQSVFHMLCI